MLTLKVEDIIKVARLHDNKEVDNVGNASLEAMNSTTVSLVLYSLNLTAISTSPPSAKRKSLIAIRVQLRSVDKQ